MQGGYMTVSYSINGKSIQPEELSGIRITKKDYIDYMENIKQSASNSFREQEMEKQSSGVRAF